MTAQQTPDATSEELAEFVYAPHPELLALIERLEAALDDPRKRRDAIEAAIDYLLKIYQLFDEFGA
jgi:hypothetical protein